jgi:predicted glutamine amidotransferase
MCRLYTFRSSHRRKIECELIRSQNSLLRQSRGDADGRAHSDGWGLGYYTDAGPVLTRRATSANVDDSFRWAAAWAFSTNVIAHVRSATIGGLGEVNAHPFREGTWLFAHNGTVAAFPLIRDRILAAMTPEVRALRRGSTDSEHIFHLILSTLQQYPEQGTTAAVRNVVHDVTRWAQEADAKAEVAINLVLTDGKVSTLLRYGRSLWYVTRRQVHACEACSGALHIAGTPPPNYRAIAFASEPLTTDEAWVRAEEGRISTISPLIELTHEAL